VGWRAGVLKISAGEPDAQVTLAIERIAAELVVIVDRDGEVPVLDLDINVIRIKCANLVANRGCIPQAKLEVALDSIGNNVVFLGKQCPR
jgi:hypothetical protein